MRTLMLAARLFAVAGLMAVLPFFLAEWTNFMRAYQQENWKHIQHHAPQLAALTCCLVAFILLFFGPHP